MARMQLGAKRVTPEAIEKWKAERGYDKPLLFNAEARGRARSSPTRSSSRSRCACSPSTSATPTTAATSATRSARAWGRASRSRVPVFLVGLAVYITFALVHRVLPRHLPRLLGRGAVRGDDVDLEAVLHHRRAVPGQQAVAAWCRSPATPAASTRCKFLRAAGADRRDRRHRRERALVPHDLPRGDRQGLRAHRARQGPRRDARCCSATCCKNALIPILTGVVVVIPLLFIGSLLTESFFGIPGLGSYTIDAIQCAGLRRGALDGVPRLGAVHPRPDLLTDISYTLVDPRVQVRTDAVQPVVLWTDALVWLLRRR